MKFRAYLQGPVHKGDILFTSGNGQVSVIALEDVASGIAVDCIVTGRAVEAGIDAAVYAERQRWETAVSAYSGKMNALWKEALSVLVRPTFPDHAEGE